jgi:translation initiation factor 3 subunit D
VYDDPIMVELMEAGEAEIFTTDVVAAVLMCSGKSNYSWDLEIKKVDGLIIIDKRTDDDNDQAVFNNDKMNILNYQTVCETALENQPTDNDTIGGIK